MIKFILHLLGIKSENNKLIENIKRYEEKKDTL